MDGFVSIKKGKKRVMEIVGVYKKSKYILINAIFSNISPRRC